MPRESVVEYRDDDYNIEITVVQASLERGFTRASLSQRMDAQLRARKIEEGAEIGNELQYRFVAIRTYPEVMAATKQIKNVPDASGKSTSQLSLPMSFEDFIALPEALVMLWEQAVYAMNPHWVPKRPKEEAEGGEAEKQGEPKEPSSS